MRTRSSLLLIAPAILIIGIFMLIPMFIALAYSFMTANAYGGVEMPATFDAYIQFLYQRDFDDSLIFVPDYIFIILRSIYLAVATTITCLVLGLPVAWYIVCQNEQRRRLQERLTDDTKNWKFRLGDLDDRQRWGAYTKAYQGLLSECSTKHAPWYVVPADDKKVRNWLIARTIADTLDGLGLRYPPADPAVRAIEIE